MATEDNNIQALIDFINTEAGFEQGFVARPKPGDEIPFAVVPSGKSVLPLKPILDQFLDKPERRAGTAELEDIESFVAHANRFKAPNSAIFACSDRSQPSLTAVLDYHCEGPEGEARFGRHRSVVKPQLSDAWEFWLDIAGQPLSQSDFAELIEDRVDDLAAPPPPESMAGRLAAKLGTAFASVGTLMDLSKGLHITETANVKEVVDTQSGQMKVLYETEHTTGAGQPVNVPKLFCINVRVFHNGPFYEIGVRLRYRKDGQRLKWIVAPYRPDLIFDNAWSEILAEVRAKTELPVLLGKPEAAS